MKSKSRRVRRRGWRMRIKKWRRILWRDKKEEERNEEQKQKVSKRGWRMRINKRRLKVRRRRWRWRRVKSWGQRGFDHQGEEQQREIDTEEGSDGEVSRVTAEVVQNIEALIKEWREQELKESTGMELSFPNFRGCYNESKGERWPRRHDHLCSRPLFSSGEGLGFTQGILMGADRVHQWS